ncbi:MAG: hypothetical protein HYR74_13155 [Candidatus Eisenbacteria bacterium]|nr:hypothetical protein [Candidatus Eisenbacteria bacterium]
MIRLLRWLLFVAPVLAVLPLFMAPRTGEALPLFARKYEMQCTQCHYAFPRLNPFGMQFRQNGYRMVGEKGSSPWESKEFPLSLVGNVGIQSLRTEQGDPLGGPRTHFTTSQFAQNAVEFHTAGTLGPNFTFHFDNNFVGPGGPLASGMAFLQLDDVGKDGCLNIKAGVYDAEIPYLSDSRKTTLNGYINPITLDGRGVELNGTRSGWTYAAGLINSDRSTGKPGSTSLNNLENGYVWLMRDIRGQLVTVRVATDRQDPRVAGKDASTHLIAQASAYLNHGRWALIPGYTFESFADEPDTIGVGTGSLDLHGALLEGMVYLDPNSRWLLTGRYEIRHVGISGVSATRGDDIQTALNLSYFVNPNAKIALDWTRASMRLHNSVEDNPTEPVTNEIQLYGHVGY